MNDTRKEIVKLAEELICSIGYNAFSYADIAQKLSIKNAAVHYHFPAKSDLGIEVIQKNLKAFTRKAASWRKLDYKLQLIMYLSLNDRFAKKRQVCVIGSLSPSFDTLPKNMQEELQNLVNTTLDWLTNLLEKGKDSKVFSHSETSRTKAFIIQSAITSSLSLNKVLKNNVYKSIKLGLLRI